jgi:cellulose synthase/poly-beta-1,6-N-acetylglucosamine synthase-like glycosyltransferase
MFEIIFLIFLCGYFIQSVLFVIGTNKKYPKISDEQLPKASVIVAVRNEEKNILRCLNALDKLVYPEGKLEIIISDGHSTDATVRITDNFIENKKRFRRISANTERGNLKGKANAIDSAVRIAEGEIILTTDADCEVNPLWAKTICSYYTKNTGIVNGFTTQTVGNGFSGMQAIDFIYLLIVAAGTINLGLPISCMGNNMSYRKKAYFESGGYENLPFSVTEDFNLLRAVNRLAKYRIIFPLDKSALVTSLPCCSLRELYHQKKRWGVGGLGSPLRGFVIMSFGMIVNLCLVLTPVFFSEVSLYLVIFKLAIDLFVLYPVHNRLGIKYNLKYFIQFELYFIVYVIILPLIVLSSRKVLWKGKEY